MANRPLNYELVEQKASLGALKGKIVLVARPTGRKRIAHRDFCEEVARATTFTGAEVEAVLRLAAEMAKKHVENGDIVDFGDLGTLTPSFQSVLVEKGAEEFNANKHIKKPKVALRPNARYFRLDGVSYERVAAPVQKEKKEKKGKTTVTPET